MKLVNKSDFHVVVYNGKTFEKLDAGQVSSDIPEKFAQENLKKFSPLLGKYEEVKEVKTKKPSKKGKDKKMPDLED